MSRTLPLRFQIGPWIVDRDSGCLTQGEASARLDDRTLRLLVHLAERAGEVVGVETLVQAAWPDVVVSPDAVYQAIATLRRTLGDPAFIVTVPRRGYRLAAPIKPESPKDAAQPPLAPARPRRRVGLGLLLIAALGLAGVQPLVATLADSLDSGREASAGSQGVSRAAGMMAAR